MKRIFSLFLAVVAIATLAACGSNENLDHEFDLVFEEISVPAETTQNLSLPTTSQAVTRAVLYWDSNLKSVITNSGVVIRQDEDKNVTLTLKVKIDNEERDFQFTVKVLKKEDVVPPVPEIKSDLHLDLSTATTEGTATTYVTTATNTVVTNLADNKPVNLKRINANISTENKSGIGGVVTSIRSDNGFASPSITTDFKVAELSKIEFTFYNWTTDASFNLESHLDKLLVQVSTDNTTWVDVADVTDQIKIEDTAKNEISVELEEEGTYFVRILVKAKTGIEGTYQLRFIFTELVLHGSVAVPTHEDVFAGISLPAVATNNLTLPTTSTIAGATLSWSSSNTDVISNAGVVTRTDEEVNVTLTLTVNLNGENKTKTFIIKVERRAIHEDVFALISVPEETDENIALPTTSTIVGATLSWSSSNEAVISNTGVVTLGDDNVEVTLTLSVTLFNVTKTKTFEVLVLKRPETTFDNVFAEIDKLMPETVTKDITLPTNTKVAGAVLSWESDLPQFLSATGVVIRADEDKEVTLTLKVEIGDETDEKEYKVTVLMQMIEVKTYDFNFTGLTGNSTYVKEETATVVTNLIDNQEATLNRYSANISGTPRGIVLAIVSNSEYVSPYISTGFKVSNLSKISFNFNNWSTDASYNLDDFLDKMLVQISENGTDWITAADITNQITKVDNGVHGINVSLDEAGDYYVRIIALANAGLTQYSLRFIVTNLALYSEVEPTAANVLADFDLPKVTEEDLDLLITSSFYGAELSWESSNEDIISNEGVVNQSNTEEVVRLTLTVIYKGETLTKTFDVKVPELFEHTVANAIKEVDKLMPETATVDFELPTTTRVNGATYTWTSNNTAIVITEVEGKIMAVVTLPEDAEATVTLTLTVNLGIDEGGKEYQILLPKNAFSVTTQLPSATTDMTVNNNASLLGLDPEVFTLSATLNSSSNGLPKIYNTDIRMYGGTGGNGTAIQISIKDGLVMTSVSVKFGSASYVNDVEVTYGTNDPLLLTKDSIASQTKIFNDGNASIFKIQVKSTSLTRISAITITYKSI